MKKCQVYASSRCWRKEKGLTQALYGDLSKQYVSWPSTTEKNQTITLKACSYKCHFSNFTQFAGSWRWKTTCVGFAGYDRWQGRLICIFSDFYCRSLTANSRLFLCLKFRLKDFHLHPWFLRMMPSSIFSRCQQIPSLDGIGLFPIKYHFFLSMRQYLF